jgi:hypothetical protein
MKQPRGDFLIEIEFITNVVSPFERKAVRKCNDCARLSLAGTLDG